MSKEISLTARFCQPAFSFESLCVCSELIACIQAIWNRISVCMTAVAHWLHLIDKRGRAADRALQNQFIFSHITSFLPLKDVAICEILSKSLKVPDSAWKWQCRQEQVSYSLPEGHHKEAFSNPEPPARAFGPADWKEHLKVELDLVDLNPKTRARLPARIHRQAAQFKETRRLLLIPGTIEGQPFCYETFVPIAERAGMRLDITHEVLKEFGKQPAGASRWVWIEVEIKEGSRNKTHEAAERDYPGELGRSLWYIVMVVADYARDKICRFPQAPVWTYVWTEDGGKDEYGDWFVIIGGSAPGVLFVRYHCLTLLTNVCIGVAGARACGSS